MPVRFWRSRAFSRTRAAVTLSPLRGARLAVSRGHNACSFLRVFSGRTGEIACTNTPTQCARKTRTRARTPKHTHARANANANENTERPTPNTKHQTAKHKHTRADIRTQARRTRAHTRGSPVQRSKRLAPREAAPRPLPIAPRPPRPEWLSPRAPRRRAERPPRNRASARALADKLPAPSARLPCALCVRLLVRW